MCVPLKGTPRVALIAVHGISDHAPCETARQVADALLTYGQIDGSRVHYETAHEIDLRIPVQPVKARRVEMLAMANLTELSLPLQVALKNVRRSS